MFARVTFQLPEATRPRIVMLPIVADVSRLIFYLHELQQWSCARITQAELIDLVNFDGISAGNNFQDFRFSSVLSMRDKHTWEPFSLILPAPVLSGLERDYQRIYRVNNLCGDALTQAYGRLIGRDLAFDGGALT
ncbi:MAG: hypothetical protein RBT80_19190 [Candidatus Vecturithrix sp.]|jgi:hypothetical protein|nr:hypothetical protein [Candidatus Vecturithrix sp.]